MKMEEIECSETSAYNSSLTILRTSYPAYEDGTDTVFRNVGIQQSDAGEIPERIHTGFKTRRKFEIKNVPFLLCKQRLKSSQNCTGQQWLFFSGVRKNHVSAICGQKVELLNVKTVDIYCNPLGGLRDHLPLPLQRPGESCRGKYMNLKLRDWRKFHN